MTTQQIIIHSFQHSSLRSQKTFNYEGPFNHFLNQIFLPGRAESGSWWSHVGTYFAAENWQAVVENDDDDDPAPRLFCLWYEQMLRAPAEGVQGIAEFVGKSVSMIKAEEIGETKPSEEDAERERRRRLLRTL